MSIAVTSAIWQSGRFKGTELLVLLALADFSDDKGVSWPSVMTLARKARVSRRTAQRMINRLAKQGVLVISNRGGGRRTCRYRIVLAEFNGAGTVNRSVKGRQADARDTAVIPGALSICHPSDATAMTPKPSVNGHRTINRPVLTQPSYQSDRRQRDQKRRELYQNA